MATFIKAGFWEQLCKPCRGYKGWLNLDELIKSLAPPAPEPAYRVYTALLTQSGGDDPQFASSNTGTLTIGVTYLINDNLGGDFTNVGSPDNNNGTYFVATGTTPNNWGGGGNTLIYNTGAPVVTVLENTIGNIWFEYGSVYSLKSNGLFTQNKTYFSITETIEINSPSNTRFSMYNYDNSTISIVTYDPIGDFYVSDALLNTPIEIRVYN